MKNSLHMQYREQFQYNLYNVVTFEIKRNEFIKLEISIIQMLK